MKKIRNIAFALLTLSACTPQVDKQNVQLLNGLWTITEINGGLADHDSIPLEIDLNIEQNTFAGNAGCNTISGSLETDTNKVNYITFAITDVSKMKCDNMTNEANLLNILPNIVSFRIDTIDNVTTVSFANDGGNELLRLNYLKGREATEWSINGRWIIKSVNGISTEGTEAGTELVFDLGNNMFSGKLGCNSFSGLMLFSDDHISFSDIDLTEMACDDKSMNIEENLLTVLGYICQWTVQNGELILYDTLEKNIIVLIRD